MSAWIILGGLSILLFIAELAFLDFSCLVFAMAFACVAFISTFIDAQWWVWAILACALSLVFFLTIRTPIKRFFSAKKTEDNFLDDSGVGEIKQGMVYFKGTYFKSADIAGLADGTKVDVLGVKNGQIIIKK